MTEGVDVSYAQGNYRPGQFGERFVIINASRANVGFAVGSYYHQQVANARAAGVEVGHYFFNGNIDPTQCADYFVNNLYDFRQGDTLWLDVESEAGTSTRAWTPAQALAFINRVKARTGVVPGVYLNQSLMNGYDWSAVVATGAKLWLAYYNNTLPAIRWWASASVWQYTSTPIDRNRVVSGASLASVGGATAIVEPPEDEDMGLPVSLVKDANSASIYVVGPTGKRAGVGSTYHVSLLLRAQKNKADDPMTVGELNIVAGYLAAVTATPAATATLSVSDAQLADIATQVAAKITAAPQTFNINLSGKAEA